MQVLACAEGLNWDGCGMSKLVARWLRWWLLIIYIYYLTLKVMTRNFLCIGKKSFHTFTQCFKTRTYDYRTLDYRDVHCADRIYCRFC